MRDSVALIIPPFVTPTPSLTVGLLPLLPARKNFTS
jgi:hypothetical protein